MEDVLTTLEWISYMAIIIGIPIALYQFYQTKKKEQQDREYGTYHALDEKYLEYQNLCLRYPYLDIFDVPDANPRTLTEEQKKEEMIAFTILFSIFERAYLMYHDQSTEIKRKQWSGWNDYIVRYWKRDNFRRAWEISGKTFDEDFEKKYMEKIKRKILASQR